MKMNVTLTTVGLLISVGAMAGVTAPASMGYLRVQDARIQPQGSFVFASNSSLSLATDMFGDGADDVQFDARAKGLVSVLDYLQLGLSIGTRANHHAGRLPPVSQTVGDPGVLLRGGYLVMDMISFAGELEVALPTSAEGFGLAFDAVSPKLTTAVGYHAPFGLSAAFNLGASWDRTELAFTDALDPILRYSAGVSNTPWVDLGLAIDYSLELLEVLTITPFLETSFLLPVGGVDTAAGMAGLAGGGLRTALGKENQLAVTLAAEVGYLRPNPNEVAVPAVPPWAASLGLAYAFDPFARPTAEAVAAPPPPPPPAAKEVIKEVAPPTGVIKGAVVDSVAGTPVVDAIVTIDGVESSPLAVNGADGSFQTYPLAANRPYKLKVVANGYNTGEVNAVVGVDAVRTVEVALVQTDAEQFGELRGAIKSADGKPLEASIVVTGVKGRFTTDPATGSFSCKLPVGDHTVAIGAPGYRAQKKKVKIRPGDVVIINVDLAK